MATGNSTDNVRRIGTPRAVTLDPVLESSIEDARKLIRAAVTVAEVSGAAAVSTDTVDPFTLRRALEHVAQLLEEAHEKLDPVALVRFAPEVRS